MLYWLTLRPSPTVPARTESLPNAPMETNWPKLMHSVIAVVGAIQAAVSRNPAIAIFMETT